MRSYIKQLCSKEEAPFQWKVTIPDPDESFLEKKLRNLVRSRKQMVNEEQVGNGCIVTASLESSNPRLNRKMIPISVGEGLLDPELENLLLGMKKGEEKVLDLHDTSVKVNILSIYRIVFPEPVDADVAAYCEGKEELEGIQTVEAYQQHLMEEYREEQKEMILGDAAQAVYQHVLNHSDWEFDPEEEKTLADRELEFIRQQLEEEGKKLETLSEEELQEYFGISSSEEIADFMLNHSRQTIASVLWWASESGKDPLEVDLMENEMNWNFLMDYVAKKIEWLEERK